MFKKLILTAALLSFSSLSVALTSPAPAPKNPDYQIPQGLYATPQQAYDMMQKDKDVILVDVRTPEEWMFVGYTPMAQIMLPSVMFDYSQMDTRQKLPRYMPAPNDNWISDFEEQLADLGGDEESKILVMCRSASERAAPMAKVLDQYGYKNVYLLLDGFEGGTAKDGDKKGFRVVNGWKNTPGLPWTYDIQEDKVYFKKYGVKY